MKAFYHGTFALEALPGETDQWVELNAGGVHFALHAIPAGIAGRIQILDPPEPRSETPYKLTFEVEDADWLRNKLEASGIQCLARPWGGYDLVDPEGNIVTVATLPATPARY